MTDNNWDFSVKRIELNNTNIDAGQKLGIVVAQPQYDIKSDSDVPFRIEDPCREAQRNLIERAFQIRETEMGNRQLPIPFILFPEVSIPIGDQDGLDCLKEQLEESQSDVIFIGGLEGLSPTQVVELTDKFPPSIDSAKPEFGGGSFVNLCVIVVKSANNVINWHFQAKISPSQWEQPRNMACGRRVLHFIAPTSNVSFLCQICFDHIAAQGHERFNTSLCSKLIDLTRPNAAPLDYVFIPQYNKKPVQGSQRESADILLNYSHNLLKNDMLAIISINKAAEIHESLYYGRSSLHYRKGKWQVPQNDIGPKGYALNDDNDLRITSAVFRKRTQALHVATLIPPAQNIGDSGNPRQPLENPRSYLIEANCDPTPCSCLPEIPIENGPFVECDCLPCKIRDTIHTSLPQNDVKMRWDCSEASQSRIITGHYNMMRKAILNLKPDRARNIVYLLLNLIDGNFKNPDLWDNLEKEAIIDLILVLCVLSELYPFNFDVPDRWTARLNDCLNIAVIYGYDKTHWEFISNKYKSKFAEYYTRYSDKQNPVLLVALKSKGVVNPFVQLISSDFVKPSRVGNGNTITKPTPLKIYICQDILFEDAKQKSSIAEYLKDEIREVLN